MRDLLPTHSRRRAIRGTLTLIRSNIVAKSEWGGGRVEEGYDSVCFTDEFSRQIHGHEYMDNIKYLF